MAANRRVAAVVLWLSLGSLVAACGSSAAPTAAATADTAVATTAPTAGQSAGPANSAAAGTPAASTPGDTGAPAAILGSCGFTNGGVPDLEAMLPSAVSGAPWSKSSCSGGDPEAASGWAAADVATFLAANGKTAADFSVGLGNPVDPSMAGSVVAIRVKGADGQAMLQAILSDGNLTSTETTSETVSGKQVLTDSGGLIAFYVKDDVVFQLTSMADDTETAAVLAALP